MDRPFFHLLVVKNEMGRILATKFSGERVVNSKHEIRNKFKGKILKEN